MPDTAKVKNVGGEDLIDAWSGWRLVEAGQVLEVPVDDVYAYTHQAGRWAPVDAPAKKAHKEGEDARAERDAAEAALTAAFQGPGDEPDTATTITTDSPAPAGEKQES